MTPYELNEQMWNAIFEPLFATVAGIQDRPEKLDTCDYWDGYQNCCQPGIVQFLPLVNEPGDNWDDYTYCLRHFREISREMPARDQSGQKIGGYGEKQ